MTHALVRKWVIRGWWVERQLPVGSDALSWRLMTSKMTNWPNKISIGTMKKKNRVKFREN